jgi:5-methylcytosine-specific restriction endonuclease McrA
VNVSARLIEKRALISKLALEGVARDVQICQSAVMNLACPKQAISAAKQLAAPRTGPFDVNITKRGYQAQMSCPRKRNKSGLRAKTDFLFAHERKAVRDEVLERDLPICVWCFEAIVRRPSMEHIEPRMNGGSYSVENFALSHRKCNFRRGNMSVLQYMAHRACQSTDLT